MVHRPALSPEQAVGHAAAPADVLSGEFAELMPQLCLRQVDDLDAVALGAAVLAHHTAGEAF